MAQAVYTPYVFNTLAGICGNEAGPGAAVSLNNPKAVASDAAGNIYFADSSFRILKATPDGVVSTLAGSAGVRGSADGIRAAASFSNPNSLAVDGAGNVYVADGDAIRKVTPGGVVTTIAGTSGVAGSADGTGAAALFNVPMGVAVDSGGTVYVADSFNNTLRRIAPDGGVTTVAGTPGVKGSADGTGSSARFFTPDGIAVDRGGTVYVADFSNDTIRKVTAGGVVTTLAGTAGAVGSADGTGAAARFSLPASLTIDADGNLCVVDGDVGSIRRITPDGSVTTLFGGSLLGAVEPGATARLIGVGSLALDPAGDLFAADSGANVLWKITPAGGVTGFVGVSNGYGSADGTGASARFSNPRGAAVDPNGNLYVADPRNNVIRRIAPGGVTTTIAGTSSTVGGSADGTGASAQFNFPTGAAVDSSGNVYVADTGNCTIRKMTPAGAVTTLAGTAGSIGSADGAGPAARFANPEGLAVDPSGNVYVADSGNDTIRKITPSGAVTTLAGTAGSFGSADGTGAAAQFNCPVALAVDSTGNLYVADTATFINHGVYANDMIRKVTPGGVVTTLAGAPYTIINVFVPGNASPVTSADGIGAAARFGDPTGVAVDSGGNVYVADAANDTIRRVTPGGAVTTIAGTSGVVGFEDGAGSAARFSGPSGIAVDRSGNVYITDSGNNAIRVGAVNRAPSVPTEPSISSVQGSQTIAQGATVVFKVPTGNSPAPTYQWYFNGEPVAGATLPTLVVTGANEENEGYYDCLATNPLGVSTNSATLAVVTTTDPGRLVNLSCRANAGTGSKALIAGFVVGGTGTAGPQTLLVRASGPALAPFAVTGFLPDPEIQLISSNSTSVVATNNGWAGSSLVTSTAAAVGAFAWANPGSQDSALVETLPAGPYTAVVSGAGGDSGITLAEIYDGTPAGTTSPLSSHLVNISARAQVGRGANVLIAGFVIGGTTPKTVLIRVSGPALAAFGVSGLLADPQLQLNNPEGVITSNTGWLGDAQVAAAAAAVGAFPWGASPTADSAVLITLPPGAYTAQVSGASGDAGVALVEVYGVD
jgi:sugar lactone lactonase YvrE